MAFHSYPYFLSLEDRLHAKKHRHTYTPRGTNWKKRFIAAIRRVGRGKYLSPKEINRILFIFFKLLPNSMRQLDNALEKEFPAWRLVGLLNGEQAMSENVDGWDNFHEFHAMINKLEAVKPEKRTPLHFELAILNFYIKHKIRS